jgi:hypothetical protein
MEFNALTSDSGFQSGDLDCNGYFTAIPAFQNIFFADGRPYNADISESGYHRLDMVDTSLVGEPSGAFNEGEVILDESNEEMGNFIETVGSGATAKNLIYRTSTTQFEVGSEYHGADSGETITPTAVIEPPHWLNWTLTDGSFPNGGSNVGCLFDGRLWLNSVWESNQWIASRQGDPFDFDTSIEVDDIQGAFSSQTSLMGTISEPLISFIPYKNAYLIFGLTDSMWILRGGSTGAGQYTILTTDTGIFSPDSWCFDVNGNLYFIGLSGFFKVSNNGETIDNISDRISPSLFKTLALNRVTDRVVMGYDRDRNLINITISLMDGNWSTSFCYNPTDDEFFPDSHIERQIPSAYAYITDPTSEQTGLWIGSYDGCIRKWDEDELSDDGEIITSKVLFGPIQVANLIRPNIKIKGIEVILSEESTNLDWALYSAESAEKLKENIESGETPIASGTFTSGGRQSLIDDKISGEFIGILFSNNTLDKTWSIEKVVIKTIVTTKEK